MYGVIAYAIRDFVAQWYGRFTHDHSLVEEVILVLSHVFRGCEERIRILDLDALILDDIPVLLWNHIRDWKVTKSKVESGFNYDSKFEDVFHDLQPHPALKSQESENWYLYQMGKGILAIFLPTEDLVSDCERELLNQILSSLILRNTINAFAQPETIYKLISKVIHSLLLLLLLRGTWLMGYDDTNMDNRESRRCRIVRKKTQRFGRTTFLEQMRRKILALSATW